MPIEFTCSQCQTVLRTPDSSAGKAARCPHCQNVEPIPIPHEVSYEEVPQASVQPDSGQPDSGLPDSGQPNPFGVRSNAAFPEMNPVGTNPYATPQHGSHLALTRRRIHGKIMPAAITCLVISGIVTLFWLLAMVGGITSIVEKGLNDEDVVMLIVCFVLVAMNLLAIFGCVRMLQLKNHTLCVVSVLSLMLAGLPCCLIPSGIGIWALVVLFDPNAKRFFD